MKKMYVIVCAVVVLAAGTGVWLWSRHAGREKVTLETADLFAWTLCVIVLSMLLERALVRLMRRIRP